MKIGQLILLLVLWTSMSVAQDMEQIDFDIQIINESNGLPTKGIHQILLDQKGFLWIAAQEGLYKFDGNEYQSFFYNPDTKLALKKGSFNQIFEDSKQRIWLTGFEGGICYINEARDESKSFGHSIKDFSSIASIHTGSVFEDREHNIWVCSNNYVLHRFNEETETFTRYEVSIPKELLNYENEFSFFGEIMEDHNDPNLLWIGSRFGVVKFNKQTEEIKLFPLKQELVLWHRFGYRKNALFQKDNLIFYGGNVDQGILVFNKQTLKYEKQIQLNPKNKNKNKIENSILHFEALNNEELIVVTKGSTIFKFNLENFTFSPYQDALGINDFSNYNTFIHQNGNTWISNWGEIRLISKGKYPFQKIHFSNYFPNLNKQNSVISFLEHSQKNILYMGTLEGDGIWKYDIDKDSMTLSRINSAQEKEAKDFDMNDMIYDLEGNLWIAGGYNIEKYHEESTDVETIEIEPSFGTLVKNPICYRLAADEKYLWIGLFENGIVRMNLKTKQLEPFDYKRSNYFLLKNQRVGSMKIDQAGKLWIGTDTGLYTYEEKDSIARPHIFEEVDRTQLKINDLEINRNLLFIGTFGQGLWQLNIKSNTLSKYKNELNPECNLIYKIDIGQQPLIWVASQFGLSYFDIKEKSFKDFSKKNSIEFTWIESELLARANGDVYYGNSWNFWKLSKDAIDQYARQPQAYIKSLVNGGDENAWSGTPKKVSLTPKQRDFSIQLGALNYNRNATNIFSYRLLGYNEEWTTTNENSLIKYSNLKHGNYQFEYSVKDQYVNGEVKPEVVDIIILPRFSETLLFKVLLFLATCFGAYLVFRILNKRNQQKNQLKLANQFYNQQELFSLNKNDLVKEIGSGLVANFDLDHCTIILLQEEGVINYSFDQWGIKESSILEMELEEFKELTKNQFRNNSKGQMLEKLKERSILSNEHKSIIYTYILEGEEFKGMLFCEHKDANYFNQEFQSLLEKLSLRLSAQIDKISAKEEIQKKDDALVKLKIEQAQSELKALRAQMNPHFLFNTLNSINWYIIKNKPLEASKYLTKFSHLMRQILDNSKSNLISLQKELDTLKLYIDLEGIRFEGQFEYEYTVDPGLDLDQLKVPPLIFQPFVENAIWHGLLHKKGNGLIKIHIHKLEAMMLCVVQDNGVGRKAAAAISNSKGKNRTSSGLQITTKRIRALSGTNKTVEIIDLENEVGEALGTRVEFYLPYTK